MDVFGMFVKQPLPGQVKTRLAAAIGPERAAAIYLVFVEELLRRFAHIGDRRWLGFAPDHIGAEEFFRERIGNAWSLWPQPETSLGERMTEFFRHAELDGATRTVLAGSDSPTLPRALVEKAFTALADHDCVFGPATDGGFYLVGQRRVSRPIFENVAWSRPDTLTATVNQAAHCGASIAVLPPWYDVDDADDLTMLRGHLEALHLAGDGTVCDFQSRLADVLD